MTILRIFSDPAWYRADAQLCPLLAPWREQFSKTPRSRPDRYAQTGRDYFVQAEPSQCDLVICPVVWRNDNQNEVVQGLARQAGVWGKPLVVFCETDSEEPFPIPDVLAFRGSLRRSRRLPTEFPAPAFIGDALAGHSSHDSVPNGGHARQDQPVVGFCGCAHVDAGGRSGPLSPACEALNWQIFSRPKLARWLQRCGIPVARSTGKRVRYQALGTVMRSPLLRKNFLLRDHRGKFIDQIMTLPETQRRNLLQPSVTEFRDNVLASDYTLCPRGGGNWSYRFYETLCLGRVPVFFDTDCVLPYESTIPWKDYCVWVDGDRIEQTAEAIINHYQKHTGESLAQLGAKCRQLWLDYLSLDGFFRNFHSLVPLVAPR